MLEAIEWYRKAADQGDADAQYNIGLCYANGDGLEEDMTMAMEWYRKAAKRGNAEAQRAIEEWNEYNNFWDYNEEEKRLRKVMKQGNADAQYNLGMCYEKGDGVKENIKKAMDLYQSSAIQGYSKAQCRLGFFYKKGFGIERNNEKAALWYHKAAEQGLAEAQYSYGIYCELGHGVEKEKTIVYDYMDDTEGQEIKAKNEANGIKWIRKAAEQGLIEACRSLGLSYSLGKGVKQDRKESIKWFCKAAEQGDAKAQCYLGSTYGFGRDDVESNMKKAVEWYRKAAEQGYLVSIDDLKFIEKKADGKADINILKELHCIIDLLQKPPYYLFFDTETTGVPLDNNERAEITYNWPRLVQLGWILTDDEGNEISSGNEIVKPEHFIIPSNAVKVHGITTEIAMRKGKPLRKVMEMFLKDVKQYTCVVGHNIDYDQKVVGAELYRLDIKDTISCMKSLCTMKATVDFCKIPDNYGYKYPKLQELHKKLFGYPFEDAHNAMTDIIATKKCFFELKRRGIIND